MINFTIGVVIFFVLITTISLVIYFSCKPYPHIAKKGYWLTRGGAIAYIEGCDPYTSQYYPWYGRIVTKNGITKKRWSCRGFDTVLGDRVYSPTDLKEFVGFIQTNPEIEYLISNSLKLKE